MKKDEQLKQLLRNINKKSYPLYKELKGSYQFSTFILNIEHVQGDPFAAPSRVSVEVDEKSAAFPEKLYNTKHKRIAVQDFLLRKMGREINRFSFSAKGSGKSGLITISRCGQEILERTAFRIKDGKLRAGFEIGFPANGRTINSGELEKIFFDYVPKIVDRCMFFKNIDKKELDEVVELAEDQYALREEIRRKHLTAFVADGSVLPRESGISTKPKKDAKVFHSPKSMLVEISLPNRGMIRGMGIPEGITLIVGGGYHGKSTLLKALEQGIYDHIKGDGREYVVTEASAVKIRSEDGRKISHIDISTFINNLPDQKDTVDFSTDNASGSTSQAANVVEAVEAGTKTLLIDEDTCATNFMVRDELMQMVIAKESEPITPFIDRAQGLFKAQGISTIIVAGSSGSYFKIADHIIQMDRYEAVDITDKVKNILNSSNANNDQIAFEKITFNRNKRMLKSRKLDRKYDQVKIKTYGKDGFSIGKESVDLKYVEQLVDGEQVMTLAYCLKMILDKTEQKEQNIDELIEKLWNQIETKGMESLINHKNIPVSMAFIRKQDIFACIDRFRAFI